MREPRLYLRGRLVYSFGKNGLGLSDEFDIINQITKLFSKDNHVSIHKAFIDQVDDVYDLIFDIIPKTDVNYLLNDKNEEVAES
jgi:hypothetical protein